MQANSSFSYFVVTLLNIIITVAEFIGGFISGSLALLSDAVHNLGDVGSLILSFGANLIARRHKNRHQTFGYARAETLAAFTNGVILIVISLYLAVNAIGRFAHPEPIQGQVMFIVSLVGLGGNLISMLVMMRTARGNLNAKVTFLNMLSDAFSSLAVVIGSVIIYLWQITWVDPLLTAMAALLLLRAAVKVTVKAANILMEANPDIDLNQVKKIMMSFPEVKHVHHVHVWQYSDHLIMLDAHINVAENLPAADLEKLDKQIGQALQAKLGIGHVTLQAECARGKNERMIAPGKED